MKPSSMNPYSAIASVYDRIGDHVDYHAYAMFVHRLAQQRGIPDTALGFDAGCGTGVLTCLLAKLGYDMIGADRSEEMLSEAGNRAMEEGLYGKVLFLRQDLRSFELYGSVQIVVCSVDSFNYLLTPSDVSAFLSRVANYLEPGGLFVFDVNTQRKFREVYGDRDYILEEDGVFCGWQNHFDEKTGFCDFSLTVFTETPRGYRRRDEFQREKYWSERSIKTQLKKAGLRLCEIYGGLQGQLPTERDERRFFVCEKPLPEDTVIRADTASNVTKKENP